MIIYEGSNHSGTGNIVVIATGVDAKCSNRKTGDMVQIWILPADELPTEAVKSGEDAAVCGTCPLRPANGGGCYVNVGQAPNSIWRKYKRGGYEKWHGQGFLKPVRIGAYGDIAEIPMWVVDILMNAIAVTQRGHTCYTHMWRTRPDLKDMAMASVETMIDYIDARELGWSTFRTTDPNGDFITVDERVCPATEGTQCANCLMCNGNERKQRAIHIPAHGATAKRVHTKREEQ